MIDQIFVLSTRGDTLTYINCRKVLKRSVVDVFWKTTQLHRRRRRAPPPVFSSDGVHFFYVQRKSLYIVCTSISNLSPSLVLSLLLRIASVLRDYCGVLSEDAIRRNFILVYELLDEILDNGYIQGTSSQVLKRFVYNHPDVVAAQGTGSPRTRGAKKKFAFPRFSGKETTSHLSANQSVIGRNPSNSEIFVDIVERVSVTLSAHGNVLSSSINGCIRMRSFLSGRPTLHLALNRNMHIGSLGPAAVGGQSLQPALAILSIEDCNFHELVNLKNFEKEREFTLPAPDGEFTAMNYRVTRAFRLPFRVFPYVEIVSPFRLELVIKLRADIPKEHTAVNVSLVVPMPLTTAAASCTNLKQGLGYSCEFDRKQRRLVWRAKKVSGGTEMSILIRASFDRSISGSKIKKEIGPISVDFEVPLYNPSGLHVRYLKIVPNNASSVFKRRLSSRRPGPSRWVRYITKSDSYTCRL